MSNQATILKISGMTCVACSTRLERVLGKVPGVTRAVVSLASEQADIVGGDPNALIAAIEKAGFQAHWPDQAEPDTRHRDAWDLGIAVACSLPLLLGMLTGLMLPMMGQLVLASIVQFGPGRRFYTGAWASLQGGMGNMDVLVVLGTSAAFGLSLYGMVMGHGDSYFESAATVVTLVLLGKVLEFRARHRAADAVTALMALRPDMAQVEQADGTTQTMHVDQVLVDMVVIIRPGERFPVDGMVLSGISQADESLVTGESLPVDKQAGDVILAGASNGSGLLRVRATQVGRDSTLGRIMSLVQQAQNSKARVQKLVDRISAIFVPAVVIIALASWGGWALLGASSHGIHAAIAVLVVACPCALGLATPAAIMVGVGMAARHGILVKGVDAFESAALTTQVIFDKTGTLTQGKPRWSGMHILAPGWDENRILALAASAQLGSEHPLAQVLLAQARDRNIELTPPQDFTAIPGQGIRATINTIPVLIGNDRLMQENGITIPPQSDGGIWIASDGQVLAHAQWQDDLRPHAATTVARLQQMGITVTLLTGDHPYPAQQVAQQLGIEQVVAQALPAHKLDVVAASCDAGQQVMMVGDGINDAAALKRASTGVAMGGGTDVALEAADMALLRPDPALVVTAILLSQKVLAKIRQNLFWAFAYNLLAIPFAISGHLSPMIAGAAMAMSSVSVVSNALTLRLSKVE